MAIITFDTLKFVEKLKSGGIPEDQAKVISEAFRDAEVPLVFRLPTGRSYIASCS